MLHPTFHKPTLLHATSPILVTTIRAVLAPGAHPAFAVGGSQLRASKAEEGEEVKEDADRHADDEACSGAWPINACATSAAKKSSESPA